MSEMNDEELRDIMSKIPTRAEFLKSQLKQRKFFDSGDYAMSKAGKKQELPGDVGCEHPVPERIPHRSALLAAHGSSPVRRPSSLVPPAERVAAELANTEVPEEATYDSDR